jgi:hypothetical protein
MISNLIVGKQVASSTCAMLLEVVKYALMLILLSV